MWGFFDYLSKMHFIFRTNTLKLIGKVSSKQRNITFKTAGQSFLMYCLLLLLWGVQCVFFPKILGRESVKLKKVWRGYSFLLYFYLKQIVWGVPTLTLLAFVNIGVQDKKMWALVYFCGPIIFGDFENIPILS